MYRKCQQWEGMRVDLVERVRSLMRGQRTLLGICGAPASGKTTLALRLVEAIPGAVFVGMDGFHLAGAELERLERAERKGAPDTFDAYGYLQLLGRLRSATEPVVYAPRFHREIEEPIAGAVAVPQDCPLVITEGNYLLLDSTPWSGVRTLLDECWFLAPQEDQRIERLVARHEFYGRDHEVALQRAHGSDQRNAELIAATAERADFVMHDW